MTRSRIKKVYVCQECGGSQPKWMGRCPDCGAWDSLQEEKETPRAHRPGAGKRRGAPAPSVTPLAEVSSSAAGVIAAGIGEFDTVLGGGAVPGSTVLIGGEPGIGKSTLLLQVAGRFAQRGIGTLYVSGEESAAQIKLRADRLGIRGDIGLLTETELTAILAALDRAAPRVLILDSIQTMFDPELQSTPGTVSQVRECAVAIGTWARMHDAVAIMIGHVSNPQIVDVIEGLGELERSGVRLVSLSALLEEDGS